MPPSRSKRSIACKECHKRKVRCSGEKPVCAACLAVKIDCIYPSRDRKTKVGEEYLRKVLEENKRLTELVAQASTPPTETGSATVAAPRAIPRADNADRNPMINERPWFMPLHASDLPIHIGEAADAAFATRLRQATSSKPVSHLPRIQYPRDDVFRSLASAPPVWPSPSRFHFLLDVALRTAKSFHIVRRSVVLANAQILLENESFCDWITKAQLWVLLAIGEVYSAKSVLPDSHYPGAHYFSYATFLMFMPCERPSLSVIENFLLMSLYASTMNRRHTAIHLASEALRISVILGLHIEISETQLRDPAVREHRCRLWWTAYRLDRAWCSRIGWPPSIPDESVEIGFPAADNVPLESSGDFGDAQYLVSAIKLAKMNNHAVNTLYVRKRQPTSFSERVQVAVRALRDWADGLPPHLKITSTQSSDSIEEHVLYQHLAYNQAVIVTTRPILLHLLQQRRQQVSGQSQSTISLSESAQSLSTACIHCARQSIGWLKQSWARGTFQTFDYFSMQFLFSSATILALSALMRGNNCKADREDFELCCDFLRQLDRSGNLGATEFCTHTEALQAVLAENLDAPTTEDMIQPFQPVSQVMPLADGTTLTLGAPDAPLQDFLNQPNIDLDFMETGGQWVDWQDVFWSQLGATAMMQQS